MPFYPFSPLSGNKIQAATLGMPSNAQSFICHVQLSTTQAAAASATAVHAAITLPATGTTVVTTAIVNPPYPRSVTITGSGSGVTGNVVIAGTNAAGAAITSTIAANGTSTVEGTLAFKTVTSITVPARSTGGETITIGTGSKIGFPYKLKRNTVLRTFLNNVLESTVPTVAVSSTALESNTFTLNSALDGHAVDLYMLVDNI